MDDYKLKPRLTYIEGRKLTHDLEQEREITRKLREDVSRERDERLICEENLRMERGRSKDLEHKLIAAEKNLKRTLDFLKTTEDKVFKERELRFEVEDELRATKKAREKAEANELLATAQKKKEGESEYLHQLEAVARIRELRTFLKNLMRD